MSDVRSYVAFKNRAAIALHELDGGTYEIARSGSHWGLGIRGDWASVWGNYYIGHPKSVQEFCADLISDWEQESWNSAHCN